MRFVPRSLLFVAFVWLCSFSAAAQGKALGKAEQKLIEFYKGIYEDGTRLKNPKQKRLFLDSLEPLLEKRMLDVMAMPGAATYSFENLKKKIRIIESTDKRLRFFSWNTEMGDAKNYIQVIAQYKDEEGTAHIKLLKPFGQDTSFDMAVDYWEINMLADGSYLVPGDGKYSTQDRAISISNFKITGSELTDTTAIFETEAGLVRSIYLGYAIQVCSAEDITVIYDDESRSLCYPVLVTMAKDKVIGRCASGENICLFYDGSIFRRKSETK